MSRKSDPIVGCIPHKGCDEPHGKDKGKGGNSIDNSGSNKYNNTDGNANNNNFSGGNLNYNEKKKPADDKDCDDQHSKDKGKDGNSIDNSGDNKYNNTKGNANNNNFSGGSFTYNG